MTTVLFYIAGIFCIVLVLHFVRGRRSESVRSILSRKPERKPLVSQPGSDQNEEAWLTACGEVKAQEREVAVH